MIVLKRSPVEAFNTRNPQDLFEINVRKLCSSTPKRKTCGDIPQVFHNFPQTFPHSDPVHNILVTKGLLSLPSIQTEILHSPILWIKARFIHTCKIYKPACALKSNIRWIGTRAFSRVSGSISISGVSYLRQL